MNGFHIISFRRVMAVLKKEFIQLWRDKTTLRMIIGIPIIQLLLFGYAINSDPKHLPTAVYSQDQSPFVRDILSGLANSEYFHINQQVQSLAEAKSLLQRGEVTFVISFPPDFGRDIIRGARPEFLIEADASDPIAISGGLAAVNGVIQAQIKQETQTGPLHYLRPNEPAYDVRIHRLYNPEGLSRFNIVPGLIAIVLTMTGVMMTALSLTRERERGTMENLLSMPVKPIEVMLGKVAPYILIGYVQAGIIMLTAHFLFNVPVMGSILLLSLGLLIFIICNLALGFTLSAKAENQMQAMQMSIFLILPTILLSGFMFPFFGMPQWAQWLGSILPSTYFIRIVRGIMLKGIEFQDMWPNVWPLLVFMIAITGIAMKVYKRKLDD